MSLFAESFTASLGFLEIPLIFCSIVGSIIVLERFLFLFRYASKNKVTNDGLALLKLYHDEPKLIRSEIASLWLQKKQKKLSGGLRILHLLVVVAPLLGLLGTVVGLIQSFNDISQQPGPVEVSVLADGLGLAMTTTAAGLAIAIPFMAIQHLYTLWIDRMIDKAELMMNQINLSIDNISLKNISL